MHITQSNLALSATHSALSYSSQSASIRLTSRRAQPQHVDAPNPSAESKSAMGPMKTSELPPALALLKLLIEKLSGQKIDLVDPGTVSDAPRSGSEQVRPRADTQPQTTVEINAESIRYEAETSSFSATGTV